jgi:glutathione S-transferase
MSGSKPRSGSSNGRKTAWEESLGRITSKLEGLLAKRKYAAGDDFTIADIVHFGWLWRREFAGIDFDGTPNIARWYSEIAGRPSVHRFSHRVLLFSSWVPPIALICETTMQARTAETITSSA